jgi:hypothetical protein
MTVRHDSNETSGEGADLVEARVIAPLKRARLEPDDLQLARFCAAIDTALQDATVAKGRAQGPAPRWARRGALAVVLAAAAAVALIAAPSLRRASQTESVTAERARKPLAIAFESDGRAPAVSAAGPLVAPAGARRGGRIGERVRFTLVGPGEVAAFAVAGGTDLELASGRLIVDYDGHGGGETLRVRSPGAVTTVVGTLFAVEALGRTSRVAVARGAVTVEGAGARHRQIAAGWSWLAEAPETEPIPSDLSADLAAQGGAAAEAPGPGESRDDTREAVAQAQAPVSGADVRVRRAPRRPIDKRDAETAYAAAEELMRAGSTTAARRALLAFVTAHSADPRAELALLDLARLALAAGHPIEARGYVTRLLASTKDEVLIDLARQVERRIDATAPTEAGPAR